MRTRKSHTPRISINKYCQARRISLRIKQTSQDMEESIGELKKLIDILDKNESMQALTRSAKTPEQIIQIAESAGIKISVKQLRFWSRELKASYFPWAEKGSQWRRKFFAETNN